MVPVLFLLFIPGLLVCVEFSIQQLRKLFVRLMALVVSKSSYREREGSGNEKREKEV
jgi:hypothetical protein